MVKQAELEVCFRQGVQAALEKLAKNSNTNKATAPKRTAADMPIASTSKPPSPPSTLSRMQDAIARGGAAVGESAGDAAAYEKDLLRNIGLSTERGDLGQNLTRAALLSGLGGGAGIGGMRGGAAGAGIGAGGALGGGLAGAHLADAIRGGIAGWRGDEQGQGFSSEDARALAQQIGAGVGSVGGGLGAGYGLT